MSLTLKRLLITFFGVVVVFFIGRWSTSLDLFQEKSVADQKVSNQLEKIRAKNVLEVVMVNGPTTYFVGAIGKEGFEYLLMKRFAEYLDVNLTLHVASTVNEAISMTNEGVGDITAGALTRTKEREAEYPFGPSYASVKELVICHQKMIKQQSFPRSLSDLLGLNIVVGKETSYDETLSELQKELPELRYETSDEHSSEQLLALVSQGEIDCTVVDSNIFSVNNRYYPALRKAFSISENKKLAWILRDGDKELNAKLIAWLSKLECSGEMAQLKDHYYSDSQQFNYVNISVFHKRLKSRLPKYKSLFVKAGKKYEIPWTLIAAQSYQESHWDRLAKSPTGVRGMMMLTLPTAKEMGVTHRLNASQSIYGGAKYYAQLLKRVSPDVQGVDRYKFAFAAYNVGMGHLIDARALARKLGRDPDSWKDLKTVLPLLAQRKYYKDLKYGYARGQEPVDYVEAIYEYHAILENKSKREVNDEK